MSDYLSLYKLELNETPFSAQRIIDTVQQASPECQLPDLVPLVLDLPVLPTLPDLSCEFDVEVPLIPLPWVCPPTVSGGITLTSCGGAAVFGTASITRTPNTCDFVLDGDIEVCVPIPCEDGFTFTGLANIEGGGEYTNLTGDLSILTLPCGSALSLNINLEDTTPNLDNVCTGLEVLTITLTDVTSPTFDIALGEGVIIRLGMEIVIVDEVTLKCEIVKTLMLQLNSSELIGAAWETVEFCDELGAPVTKKILTVA